jgi:hypothetical protein
MWQKLLDIAHQIWTNSEETRKNTGRIADLEEELEVTSSALQRTIFELARTNDRLQYQAQQHAVEMQNLELRLRLELSEKLRQLPPRSE